MEWSLIVLKRFLLLFGILLSIAVVAVPKDLKADDSYLTYEELKAYEEKRQEQEWSRQLVAYSTTLVGKRTGQCVVSLRQYFGISRNEVAGMAKYTKANTQTAKVGSIIIFKNMSRYGHVGIVIKVDGELVTYFDSNGDWRQRGAIRTVLKSDRRISGYRITNKS